MKYKYMFLSGVVALGMLAYDGSDLRTVYADQAILNPMNPNETVAPVDSTSQSSQNQSSEMTSSEESMPSSIEEPTKAPAPAEKQRESKQVPKTKTNKQKNKRKKVYVNDDLFSLEKLKVAKPQLALDGGNKPEEWNTYSKLCFELSGIAIYGRKRSES